MSIKAEKKYTIQFVNYDGTVLQTGKVAFGDTPMYTGKTPTKAEDESYIYTFNGWSPSIEPVKGDAKYTATYTATKNVYYTCSQGTGQTYTQGSGSTLKFVFMRSKNDELTFDNFRGLKYDGKMLTKDQHYTAEKGSVKIELLTTVLKSASAGEHTLTATFMDADPVDVTFTVVAAGTHTVAFNANGHGTAPAAQRVQDGQKAKKPTNPTAEGYTFGGWYTDQACTTAFDFNTAITKDITLYAKWTASSSSGGSGTNGSGGSSASGENRTAPATGDTNNTGFWILLMVLSILAIGGVTGVVVYRKKRVK